MYSNPLEGNYCSSYGFLVVREVSAHEICAMPPTTRDGRYFVVKGKLWHCSNPALSDEERQHLAHVLMQAQRAVKAAKASNDLSWSPTTSWRPLEALLRLTISV